MRKSGAGKQSSNDPGAMWRNMPGFLYLNGDVVEEVRQLSGAGGKGTVDELGFQVLYDRIAQKLFPWCSTLTSRARYFFFSAAVLDLALREVIDDALIDANADAGRVAELAERKRSTLTRTIRRIERGLSLSLVTKHEASELGIFGSLKCRRWFREDAEIGARGKILSSDARYPNAIYRGSCRSLRLFAVEDSSTTGLLRARISGKAVLSANWQSQSRLVKAVLQALDDFWTDAQDRRATFANAAAALRNLPMFQSFGGFEMTREEAGFLYERIQESTDYLLNISASQLPRLVANGNMDLESLKRAVSDTSEHELFDAGRHIDIVTTPFRALYQTYSSERDREKLKRPNLNEIQQAKDWLDATSKGSQMDWAPVWRGDIRLLIEEWVALLKGKDGLLRLVDALCERAEQVVAGRGQGKQAPHQRSDEDDSDLKRELEVRETSFRIGNGSMILRDIARGMAPR
jgi:hypothetical protein